MPMFPNSARNQFIWGGRVSSVLNSVGSGMVTESTPLRNERTFEVPLPDGVGVGADVEFYECEEPDFDATVLILYENTCTIVRAVDTDAGYEVVGTSTLSRHN